MMATIYKRSRPPGGYSVRISDTRDDEGMVGENHWRPTQQWARRVALKRLGLLKPRDPGLIVERIHDY